uniref:Beta-lactamase domain-containing protein n=1 Tax=Angiostrongylus cantonensis TaxID=6313 RepID=A0A0K0DAZ5_ANGCA
MGFLRYALIFGTFGIVAHFVINVLYTKYPLHFDGETAEGFDGVRKAFQQNFLDGWEAEGASLAVYVKGQKVVDLWGGYADKHAARKWKKDTLSVVFSCTKAVAAVCIAVLADRGRLSYDDLVSKHWPGFAKNGKENITIEWVMSHMSGLPYLDTIITEDMATDHHRMRKVLEEEKPKFTPGMSSGYHALTYGWLVDQIVRHTDDKKRSIGQFLREEITGPNGQLERFPCILLIWNV